MLSLLARNWFLLVLVGLLVVGFAGAPWLHWLAEIKWLKLAIMAVVMFLMALPIPAEEIGRTIARPWASILAVGINYGVLPLFAWGLALLMPIDALKLREGILIAAATPCTLASAAVWTRKAGGNDAAALLVTMITNGLCFIVTPYWLYYTTGTQADLTPENVSHLIFQLGVLVLLPMVVAQLVRLWPPLGGWSSANKDLCGLLSMSGVLAIVFFGAIDSSTKLTEIFRANPRLDWAIAGLQIAAAGTIVLVVHIAMVFFGVWTAGLLALERDDRIAVAISGSQKTLMVGLYLADSFGGLSMIPMVIYHCGQLIFDSIIAEWWAEDAPAAKQTVIPETAAAAEAALPVEPDRPAELENLGH